MQTNWTKLFIIFISVSQKRCKVIRKRKKRFAKKNIRQFWIFFLGKKDKCVFHAVLIRPWFSMRQKRRENFRKNLLRPIFTRKKIAISFTLYQFRCIRTGCPRVYMLAFILSINYGAPCRYITNAYRVFQGLEEWKLPFNFYMNIVDTPCICMNLVPKLSISTLKVSCHIFGNI